jgi:hypothetical protein
MVDAGRRQIFLLMLIFCRTRFEGFHCWPDAPDEVRFLRDPHRHEFHVRVWHEVNHDNRDIEFILYKRSVDMLIRTAKMHEDTMHWSCETWARYIGERMQAATVEVSEDGENGAVWFADDQRL